ncbi:MAG: CoA ester lyase [Gammaproteobacteria bacterium]|nr:CoA ester lyase [Gammaproteobacteria bacterium]
MRSIRSLLFVPATATRLFEKAHERGADVVIVDLEDSVVPERKAEARALARDAIASLHARGATVAVRVNAEPEAYAADLAAMPLAALSCILVPKVSRAEDVARFVEALGAATAQQSLQQRIRIAALIESPQGVLNAAAIAASSDRLCALGFGAEDYAAALGVSPTPIGLAWPAQQVITAAHACGLACWGLASSIADVSDLEAFADAVRDARAMGFTGSVCIHPTQVAIVNAGFGPSADELAWARRVVDVDRQARAAGAGAVLLDGRMIDRPIVERARQMLAALPK